MKLQTKYTRATFTATITVLLLASVGYYFFIRYALVDLLDQALKVEEVEIHHHIEVHGRLPAESHYHDQIIEFKDATVPEKRRFESKKLLNRNTNEMEGSRQLIFPVRAGGKNYTAIVTKSEAESEQLLLVILAITILVILLLVALLFIINKIVLKKIWQPFQTTLSAMKKFNLSDPTPMVLEQSKIDEFNALNDAWSQMAKKISQDYESLKAFADNASHEMQTPLAVINSKLDLLIQDQNISEKNMHHLQAMYDAIEKLSKLNQSLLLITKIENNQFKERPSIDISAILKERLQHLEELIHSRELTVNTDLKESTVAMHPILADILINNMLVNAIRHNNSKGVINVSTRAGSMKISNSGDPVILNQQAIFNRFEKSNSSEGMGLGLAIVKQICDTYHFKVQYSFHKGLHDFEIIYN